MSKKILIALTAATLSSICFAASASANHNPAAFVSITCDGMGKGSGVVVSERGHILTARHLVARQAVPAQSNCVARLRKPGGIIQDVPLSFVDQDTNWDAMMWQVPPQYWGPGSPYLRYCEVGPQHSLQDIYSVGFPADGMLDQLSVRAGVLGTTYGNSAGTLETDVLTTAGMSGGGVLLSGTSSLLGIVRGFSPDPATGLPSHFGTLPISRLKGDIKTNMRHASDAECAPNPSLRSIAAATAKLEELLNLDPAKLSQLVRLAELATEETLETLPSITSVMSSPRTNPENLDLRLQALEQDIEWDVSEEAGNLYLSYKKPESLNIDITEVRLTAIGQYTVEGGQRTLKNNFETASVTLGETHVWTKEDEDGSYRLVITPLRDEFFQMARTERDSKTKQDRSVIFNLAENYLIIEPLNMYLVLDDKSKHPFAKPKSVTEKFNFKSLANLN